MQGSHLLVIKQFYSASTITLNTSSSYVPNAHSFTSVPTEYIVSDFLKFNFAKNIFNQNDFHEF